jgi:hypothetical protein
MSGNIRSRLYFVTILLGEMGHDVKIKAAYKMKAVKVLIVIVAIKR